MEHLSVVEHKQLSSQWRLVAVVVYLPLRYSLHFIRECGVGGFKSDWNYPGDGDHVVAGSGDSDGGMWSVLQEQHATCGR